MNCREALLVGIDAHLLNASIPMGTVVYDIYAIVSHFGLSQRSGWVFLKCILFVRYVIFVLYLTYVQGITSVLSSRRALNSGLRRTMRMSSMWTQLKWARLQIGPLRPVNVSHIGATGLK